MTVKELTEAAGFRLINEGNDPDRTVSRLFCCDLLSIAMGRAPAGCCWVTVMANMNTLAVASLTDAAVVVLAEGAAFDEAAKAKAAEQGIFVLATDLPVFDAALLVHGLIS